MDAMAFTGYEFCISVQTLATIIQFVAVHKFPNNTDYITHNLGLY